MVSQAVIMIDSRRCDGQSSYHCYHDRQEKIPWSVWLSLLSPQIGEDTMTSQAFAVISADRRRCHGQSSCYHDRQQKMPWSVMLSLLSPQIGEDTMASQAITDITVYGRKYHGQLNPCCYYCRQEKIPWSIRPSLLLLQTGEDSMYCHILTIDMRWQHGHRVPIGLESQGKYEKLKWSLKVIELSVSPVSQGKSRNVFLNADYLEMKKIS